MINKELVKLKEKLELQINNNETYEEIYKTSVKIDELLVKYYKESALK